MKKNWLIIFVLSVLACVTTYSQTQEGYVKTLGRPDKKSMALSGVSIKVKGEHNPVLSKTDGTFSMLLTNKKNGDSYSLQEVSKNGYELNETGVIGRQYAFSDKVPLTIVMVSYAQLQADKQRIENNAYKVAEKNYKVKLAFLEEQKEKNTISKEKYREELQDLQDKFEKYQLMIDGLAEHYAHVDYDVLDENGQKINTYIENGELERADSLISQMFDPIEALRRNKEALSKINQQLLQANELMDKANKDWAALLKQQEKDAEHLYQLYTIALSRFDNDKARFYIETRAELDTTNVDWQNDAGKFIHRYVEDYAKVLIYYERGLNHSILRYGDNCEWVAVFYSNIGGLYDDMGDYPKALNCQEKALSINKLLYGENHPSLLTTYNNIGTTLLSQGKYIEALNSFSNALAVCGKCFENDNPWFALCYHNIGSVYNRKGDYERAIDYFSKSLNIMVKEFGEDYPEVASIYNGMGDVYYNLGNFTEAKDCFVKALGIQEKLFGKTHSDVATSLNNIGIIYDQTKNYEDAFRYYNEALSIREDLFGENHVDIATSHISIGLLLVHQGLYDNSLNHYNKALSIYKNALGDEHPNVAKCYDNIGMLFFRKGELDSALNLLLKSNDIKEKTLGTNHPEIAFSLANLSIVYFAQKNYVKTIDCLTKAKSISEETLGNEHPFTRKVINDIKEINNYIESN